MGGEAAVLPDHQLDNSTASPIRPAASLSTEQLVSEQNDLIGPNKNPNSESLTLSLGMPIRQIKTRGAVPSLPWYKLPLALNSRLQLGFPRWLPDPMTSS